jgi:hypothetical protein
LAESFRMNFRYLLVLIACVSSFQANSQTTISPFLAQRIQQNYQAVQRIQIYMRDRVDTRQMSIDFQQEQRSQDDRVRTLNQALENQAEQSQRPVVDFIQSYLGVEAAQQAIVRQFHIVNMMVVDATPDLIYQLASLPQIEHIESNDRFSITPVPIVEKHSDVSRSVGGHEAGLEAIHAPFMWNLGYTGLGRKLFTCDTGVWPVHPAISRQYRGNFYPQSMCWKGFDSETPADKPDAHGTHVTGTVLGLDTATADTIGVAFNATYMASDPIVENPADIKPVTVIFEAFEFAINPDGDVATSYDVPDVICNSWGVGDSIFEGLCTAPFMIDLFTSLDAAGIAVEFSAGNEGPGAGTIGLPQYVTFDSLSIFTVGALNANTSSLPIASFSSRGPTSCDVIDAWKIKPEVSAPGVDVRSCVQWNQYAQYSGTSMAGPHVAGAVLLLKEAFPYLTGRDLLNALYQSAIDLGTLGEDNTYGRGMINLEAAYNFLASQNTPVLPNTSGFDIAIVDIEGDGFACSENYQPTLILKNLGTEIISGGMINWTIDGLGGGTSMWNGTLMPGAQTNITLTPASLSLGNHEIIATFFPTGNFIERDLDNNSRVKHVYVQPNVELPYAESFENNDLSANNWLKINYDNSKTWDTTHTAGLNNSRYSARMNFFNYPTRKQIDDLITPVVNVPASLDSLFLRFDLAYRLRNTSVSDTLDISVSANCGESWTSIFHRGGQEIETLDTVWTNFRPFSSSHWDYYKLDLLPYATGNSILVRFRGINGAGTNLYLDNIGIYSASDPTGIEDLDMQASVFPNPASSQVCVQVNKSNTSVAVQLIDLQGRLIQTSSIAKGTKQTFLDLNQLSKGVYLIRLQSGDNVDIKRLVIQ